MGLAKTVQHTGGWLVALGVLQVLAGVLAIALPLAAGLTVAWVAGVVLAAVGIVQLVGAFRAGSFGLGLADALGGVLYLVAGVVTLLHPLAGLQFLTLLLALFLLVRGGEELAAAFALRPGRGWGWLCFGGVLSLVLGFLLLAKWPWDALWVVGVFVGIEVLWSGWANVLLGGGLRSAGKSLESASS